MKYRYLCDVKPLDLWKMAMERTYKSTVGVVNAVFTVGMVLLTLRFWGTAPDIFRGLMIFGCVLFPVLQPLATYGMSVKQLEELPGDLELAFDDSGVLVRSGGRSENIRWNRITNAIKRQRMIVILSDDRHGYMLTDRELGSTKEEFYGFLCEKISRRA